MGGADPVGEAVHDVVAIGCENGWRVGSGRGFGVQTGGAADEEIRGVVVGAK